MEELEEEKEEEKKKKKSILIYLKYSMNRNRSFPCVKTDRGIDLKAIPRKNDTSTILPQ